MRYQVISKNHRVFRKSYGEYFERNLPEAQERHLIGGGFIVRAPLSKKKSRPSVEAVVLEKPSAATDDAPPSETSDEASTDNPEGMSSSV